MVRLPRRSRGAFTLLEAAVVLALAGIVAGLAVSTFQSLVARSTDARNAVSLREFTDAAFLAALARSGGPGVVSVADADAAAASMQSSGASWTLVSSSVPVSDPRWAMFSPSVEVVHVAISGDGTRMGAAMVSRPSASCVFAYRGPDRAESWTVDGDVQAACSGLTALALDTSPDAVLPEAVAAPGVPSVSVVSTTSSTVNLAWPAVAYADGYTVAVDGAAPVNATREAFVASGLSPSTSYAFEVRAFNEFGVSQAALVVAVTLPLPPSAPSPSAEALSSSSVRVSWPSVPGAVDYVVSLADGSVVATTAVTSVEHAGLAPATVYDYRVVARNSGGVSPSGSTSVTTQTPTPVSPMLAGDCGALTGTSATGVCNVSWDAPAWAVSYRVQTVGAADSGWYTTATTSVSFQGAIGLAVGDFNVVRVRACNASGVCSSLVDGGSYLMRAAPAPAVPTVTWACAPEFGACQATVQAQWAQGYHVQNVYHSGNGYISCPGGCSDDTGEWTVKYAPEGFYNFYMFGSQTRLGGAPVTLTVGRPSSPIFGVTGRIVVAGSNNAGDGYGHCIPPARGVSPDPSTCRYADVATSQ